MSKKIAIGSWAYIFGPYQSHPIPLDTVAQKLSELKFDGIELCGFRPHAYPDDYPTKESRREMLDMLKKNGLEIAGYAADFTQFTPASNDEEVRKGYIECFEKNLQFCVDCGISSIRVDTVNGPPLPPDVDYTTAWTRVVTAWKKCAQIAADAGVLLVWEFEPGFMFNKPSEVVKMLQAVNHPNFKIMFDTCHAHMCSVIAARQPEPKETLPGGVVEFARLLTGNIGHIHLIDSDNTLHDNETSTHAPFGDGVLDFDPIMPAIVNAGYTSDWWSIDLCFWAEAWEVTARCKRFVDQLRQKYG